MRSLTIVLLWVGMLLALATRRTASLRMPAAVLKSPRTPACAVGGACRVASLHSTTAQHRGWGRALLPWAHHGRVGARKAGSFHLLSMQDEHAGQSQGAASVAAAGALLDDASSGATPERACWVRCVEGEPHLSVAIEMGGKESVLHRMQEDPLQTTLDRLQKLFKERFKDRTKTKRASMEGAKKEKKIKGKGKGRRREADAVVAAAAASATAAAPTPNALNSESSTPVPGVDVSAKIWVADSSGNEVPEESFNKNALVNGHVLHVGEMAFNIRNNMPSVKNIMVRQRPIVGFTIQPEFTCEFDTPAAAVWRWWRVESTDEDADGEEPAKIQVGRGENYAPTTEDIGKTLIVELIPAREGGEGGTIVFGRKECVTIETAVVEAPDLSVHAQRLSVTPRSKREVEGGRGQGASLPLRVVSYNILADAYANTKFAREKLYDYCPPSALRCVSFCFFLVVLDVAT